MFELFLENMFEKIDNTKNRILIIPGQFYYFDCAIRL